MIETRRLARRAAIMLALATLTTAAALPEAASAEVFCVKKPFCAGVHLDDADAALLTASSNGEEDTVYLGASSTPYNGLAYNSSEKVTIKGDGPGETVVASNTFATPLVLLGGASRVENLEVRMTDAQDVGLRLGGAWADGVNVHHTGSRGDVDAVRLEDFSRFAGGVVTTPTGTGIESVGERAFQDSPEVRQQRQRGVRG